MQILLYSFYKIVGNMDLTVDKPSTQQPSVFHYRCLYWVFWGQDSKTAVVCHVQNESEMNRQEQSRGTEKTKDGYDIFVAGLQYNSHNQFQTISLYFPLI